jgi:hypothetical protein
MVSYSSGQPLACPRQFANGQSGRTNFRGRLGVRPLALYAVVRYSRRSHRHQHFPLPMVRVGGTSLQLMPPAHWLEPRNC